LFQEENSTVCFHLPPPVRHNPWSLLCLGCFLRRRNFLVVFHVLFVTILNFPSTTITEFVKKCHISFQIGPFYPEVLRIHSTHFHSYCSLYGYTWTKNSSLMDVLQPKVRVCLKFSIYLFSSSTARILNVSNIYDRFM
jgi:hypothetical protein